MSGGTRITPFAVAIACLLSPCAGAESPPAQPPAAIAAAGSIRIEVELTASGTLPDASVVSLNAAASAIDAQFINSLSASAQVSVAGHKVTTVLTLPYSWRLASGGAKVHVSLGAYAYANDVDVSSQFESEFALPANGAATTVRFTGTI